MKQRQFTTRTESDYLASMNPFLAVHRTPLGEWVAKVFGESHQTTTLDPDEILSEVRHKTGINATPAVTFEIERFKAMMKSKEHEAIEVDDQVGPLLATHIERFVLAPPTDMKWDRNLHAAYTTAFVLSVPIVLRNAWLQAEKPPVLTVDIVGGFVASIKPLICPC